MEAGDLRAPLLVFASECVDHFVTQIRYHPECWKNTFLLKITTINCHTKTSILKRPKQLFLKHVNKGIFEENEPETLKGLIDDYNDILTNHNFPIINRPATIKTMIPKKIDKTIDFHNRVHKYKSAIGYDISERRFIYRDSSKFLGDINQ